MSVVFAGGICFYDFMCVCVCRKERKSVSVYLRIFAFHWTRVQNWEEKMYVSKNVVKKTVLYFEMSGKNLLNCHYPLILEHLRHRLCKTIGNAIQILHYFSYLNANKHLASIVMQATANHQHFTVGSKRLALLFI